MQKYLLPPPRLRSPRSRLSLRRCFPRFRSANSSSGVRPNDRVGVLVVGYQHGLHEGKGRGGSRLSSIGRLSTRAQAASTERTSACRDAGLSDERRAQAVSITAVANAKDKSTLGANTMHPTMPLTRASLPGRDRWDATSCGRDDGDGAAVAPAEADATDWARACCTLFATRDASREAVFACSISLSNRRRRAIV